MLTVPTDHTLNVIAYTSQVSHWDNIAALKGSGGSRLELFDHVVTLVGRGTRVPSCFNEGFVFPILGVIRSADENAEKQRTTSNSLCTCSGQPSHDGIISFSGSTSKTKLHGQGGNDCRLLLLDLIVL